MKKRNLISTAVLFLIFSICFAETSAIEKIAPDYIKFINEFVKTTKKEKVFPSAMVNYPVIFGNGGDAYYLYDYMNENDWDKDGNEWMNMFIDVMKQKKFPVKISNIEKFFEFYDKENDDLDKLTKLKESLSEVTNIVVLSFCYRNRGCLDLYFGEIDGNYILWGILYGS